MSQAKPDCGRARWQPESGTAIVQKTKGKYMSTMGFTSDGQRLFPEEAVFLADREEIELTIKTDEQDERVLSKLEIFSLLEHSGIDLKAYTIYAALREQRFHVFRHNAWRTSTKTWKDLPAPRVVKVLDEALRTKVQATNDATNPPTKILRTSTETDLLFVSYDVYRPQSGFSKTRMERPDFSVIILSADGRMPSISSLHNAVVNCGDQILRLGIVGDSSLSFIEVSNFNPKSVDEEHEDS